MMTGILSISFLYLFFSWLTRGFLVFCAVNSTLMRHVTKTSVVFFLNFISVKDVPAIIYFFIWDHHIIMSQQQQQKLVYNFMIDITYLKCYIYNSIIDMSMMHKQQHSTIKWQRKSKRNSATQKTNGNKLTIYTFIYIISLDMYISQKQKYYKRDVVVLLAF